MITDGLAGGDAKGKKGEIQGKVTGKVKFAYTLEIVHDSPAGGPMPAAVTANHASSNESVGVYSQSSQTKRTIQSQSGAPVAGSNILPAQVSSDEKTFPPVVSTTGLVTPNIPKDINLNGLFGSKHSDTTPFASLKALSQNSNNGEPAADYDNNYSSLVEMYGSGHLRKANVNSNHNPNPAVNDSSNQSHLDMKKNEREAQSVNLNSYSALQMSGNRALSQPSTTITPSANENSHNRYAAVAESISLQQSQLSMYESQQQAQYSSREDLSVGKYHQHLETQQQQRQQQQQQQQKQQGCVSQQQPGGLLLSFTCYYSPAMLASSFVIVSFPMGF